ncbi:hypothetical protein FB107DRAFT_275605 [Schizophyllum commune]
MQLLLAIVIACAAMGGTLAAPAKQVEQPGEDLPTAMRFWAAEERRSDNIPNEHLADIFKRTGECSVVLGKTWAMEDKRGESVDDCNIPRI